MSGRLETRFDRPLSALLASSLRRGLINLDHLDRLSTEIVLDGETALMTHIYSEAPEYRWVHAPGEGIAALDDVARAAIVYLDFWRDTGDRHALARARAALTLVLHLRAEHGAFHNFLLDYDGLMNRDGITSHGALDWWTCRAFWALARGYTTFRSLDPPFAARLRDAYRATEELLIRHSGTPGQFDRVRGFRAPAWLPADSPALASLALLGLVEYQAVAPNARTGALIAALADGVAACQLGGPGDFPWGLLPHSLAAPLPWHSWGTHEAHALALAGQCCGRADWIAAAAREVDGFFSWQLLGGQLHALDPLPRTWGQQGYGINCQVQAALAVYRATGAPRYARQAGLHASWFLGNNAAGRAVYEPMSGRGYDGIDRHGEINPHAGAESTIEALMAIQAIMAVPEATRYLHYRAGNGDTWRAFDLRGDVAGQTDMMSEHGTWTKVGERARWGCHFALERPGAFSLYAGWHGTLSPERIGAVSLLLDGAEMWPIPAPSGGRTIPWLDLLSSQPLPLDRGSHHWELGLDALSPVRRDLAGLLLQPLPLARTFVGPDGDDVRATLDLREGRLHWSDEEE